MKPSEIFEGEDSSLKKAFENTKTMRERLFTAVNSPEAQKCESQEECLVFFAKFIEQELAKEREEIIEIVNQSENIWEKCEDTNCSSKEACIIANHYIDNIWKPVFDKIINTIKQRV